MPLRLLLIFSGLVAVSLPCAAAEQAVLGFVEQHCVACHGTAQPAGDLSLANSQGSFEERRHDWERVIAKVKTGEMPPAGLPRPDKAEADSVVNRAGAGLLMEHSAEPVTSAGGLKGERSGSVLVTSRSHRLE